MFSWELLLFSILRQKEKEDIFSNIKKGLARNLASRSRMKKGKNYLAKGVHCQGHDETQP